MLCFPYPSYPLKAVTQVFFLLQCGEMTGRKIRTEKLYSHSNRRQTVWKLKGEMQVILSEGRQSACMTSPTRYILRRTKGGEEWRHHSSEQVRWTTLQSRRTIQWRVPTVGHWQSGQAQVSQLFLGAGRLITQKGLRKSPLSCNTEGSSSQRCCTTVYLRTSSPNSAILIVFLSFSSFPTFFFSISSEWVLSAFIFVSKPLEPLL